MYHNPSIAFPFRRVRKEIPCSEISDFEGIQAQEIERPLNWQARRRKTGSLLLRRNYGTVKIAMKSKRSVDLNNGFVDEDFGINASEIAKLDSVFLEYFEAITACDSGFERLHTEEVELARLSMVVISDPEM
jgi:hypothetical protein